MNSRDAAFDESVQALIEATAVEAAGGKPVATPLDIVPEEEPLLSAGGSKKRRRGEDDVCVVVAFLTCSHWLTQD
jgi:hypothetical protein